MRSRSSRVLLLVSALLVACASCFAAIATDAPAASAAVTTHTPVMGPSLLNAKQLAAWYTRHSGVAPHIPSFAGHPAGDVTALAQAFIDDGKADGVRGDMAFVQSMLETGWLGFQGSQIPPDAFNYAGIYAFDGRPYVGAPGPESCAHGDSQPSRCMGTPATRRARADRAVAQLCRPGREEAEEPADRRAVGSRR